MTVLLTKQSFFGCQSQLLDPLITDLFHYIVLRFDLVYLSFYHFRTILYITV